MSVLQDIRKAIIGGKQTRYRLAKETGIDQAQLSRLMIGGGLSVENLERLADALGLKVVLQPKSKKSKGR